MALYRRFTLEQLRSKEGLRNEKKRIKRAIRKNRKELVELEESLLLITKQEKTIQQAKSFAKHRSSILSRVKKGEFRLTRDKLIKLITEEEDEIL